MREIKLSNGIATIKDFGSNIELFYMINGEDEAYHASESYDGCDDFTAEENAESFVEYRMEHFPLNENDKNLLQEELKSYYYPHSSDF